MAAKGNEGAIRRLESKPVLAPYLTVFFEAFQRLSSCRHPGMMGPGEIPWTAINEYGYRYGFFGDDFDRLIYLVSSLDQVYLSHKPEGGTTGKRPRGNRNGRK